MQTIPAAEQNKNIKWSESRRMQSGRKGKAHGGNDLKQICLTTELVGIWL